MVRVFFFSGLLFSVMSVDAQIGKVGINTTTPAAMLHVKDSSVLFTGPATLPFTAGETPVSGAGTRMMWYSDRAAFRVGNVTANQWDKDSIGRYTFAVGRNAKAILDYDISMGLQTIASGGVSVAIGNGGKALGGNSVSLGSFTIASGFTSLAMGDHAEALGPRSVAIGTTTQASGMQSTAMGLETIASGINSTAMGSATQAIGDNSTSTGSQTHAEGNTSFSMGDGTFASADLAVTMGKGTGTLSFASLALGRFNHISGATSATAWVSSDPVLMIGNGTSDGSRNNALTVLKNAKTGINVNIPQAALHIKAVDNTFDQSLRLESTLGSSSYCNILYDGSLKFRPSEASATFQWRNSANVTRMILTSAGDLSIDGALTQSSDSRLKKDIHPLENSLEKILRINGYQYYWKESSRSSDLQSGVLAQEVEQQMPELVTTDAEGMKAVNYSGLLPYLVEAIKELKQENDLLRKEIMLLKEKQKR